MSYIVNVLSDNDFCMRGNIIYFRIDLTELKPQPARDPQLTINIALLQSHKCDKRHRRRRLVMMKRVNRHRKLMYLKWIFLWVSQPPQQYWALEWWDRCKIVKFPFCEGPTGMIAADKSCSLRSGEYYFQNEALCQGQSADCHPASPTLARSTDRSNGSSLGD